MGSARCLLLPSDKYRLFIRDLSLYISRGAQSSVYASGLELFPSQASRCGHQLGPKAAMCPPGTACLGRADPTRKTRLCSHEGTAPGIASPGADASPLVLPIALAELPRALAVLLADGSQLHASAVRHGSWAAKFGW